MMTYCLENSQGKDHKGQVPEKIVTYLLSLFHLYKKFMGLAKTFATPHYSKFPVAFALMSELPG